MARRGARVASTRVVCVHRANFSQFYFSPRWIIRRGERVAGGEVTATAYRTGRGLKFKAYARSANDVPLFIKGCVGYAGVIYFLIRMLRFKDVIWVNAMWDGGSALIETLFAYFMYGERLKQPVNYAGLALIVLGLFMLRNG